MQIPEARDPGRQVVDGSIKAVQGDVHSLYAATDNFLADLPSFITEQNHMVAVPADGAGGLEGGFRKGGQQGGNLVAVDLGVVCTILGEICFSILLVTIGK